VDRFLSEDEEVVSPGAARAIERGARLEVCAVQVLKRFGRAPRNESVLIVTKSELDLVEAAMMLVPSVEEWSVETSY